MLYNRVDIQRRSLAGLEGVEIEQPARFPDGVYRCGIDCRLSRDEALSGLDLSRSVWEIENRLGDRVAGERCERCG